MKGFHPPSQLLAEEGQARVCYRWIHLLVMLNNSLLPLPFYLGVDPTMLSPTSSTDQFRTNLSSNNTNASGPNEETDIFTDKDQFNAAPPVDAYKAPRRRREPTGFAAGLPTIQAKDGNSSDSRMLSSMSLKAEKLENICLEEPAPLSARAFLGVVEGIAEEQNTLKLSPRSPRNRSMSPRNRGRSKSPSADLSAAYNPTESLFPVYASPKRVATNRVDLGIVGSSDVPRIESTDYDTNNSSSPNGKHIRDRSLSPSSPRRYLGEYENKKTNKLTFV